VILVDTSAWIEYLRATGSPADRHVTGLVRRNGYGVTDVVAAELATGARTAADLARIRGIADSGVFYPVRPLFDYEVAADLYRACREEGASPRSLTDCLVAAVAINNDLRVLAVDRDFEVIAARSELRLVDL
jgi:predicted nucleic acid-binding protein